MNLDDRPHPTARLIFGIWHDDDLRLAEAIWGDPAVTRLTGGPFSPEAVRQRLASEIENRRCFQIQYWPLFRRCGGELVGSCGLRPRQRQRWVAELGFQLCRAAWGKGYASEAAAAVIGWARKRGFNALVAGHHPDNQASKRTLCGLGFTYTHDELYPPTGEVEPCYILPL